MPLRPAVQLQEIWAGAALFLLPCVPETVSPLLAGELCSVPLALGRSWDLSSSPDADPGSAVERHLPSTTLGTLGKLTL